MKAILTFYRYEPIFVIRTEKELLILAIYWLQTGRKIFSTSTLSQ